MKILSQNKSQNIRISSQSPKTIILNNKGGDHKVDGVNYLRGILKAADSG